MRDHETKLSAKFYWSKSFSGPHIEFAGAGYFDCRPVIKLALGWLSFYLHLPFDSGLYHNCDEEPRYGFYYYNKSLVLLWNRWSKHIHMPWSWEWMRTSIKQADGTWAHERKGEKRDFGVIRDNAYTETYPYKYTLKNGEVQERTATVSQEEREWRWKWFTWLPFPRQISRTINIKFSDEVGERTGSWKGGCVGCGYELRKSESMLQCLRRMEAERKF